MIGKAMAAFVLVLGLAGAANHATAQATFKSGAWQGGPYFNGQTFSHCAVARTFSDGTQVVVQLTAQLVTYVGGINNKWNMNPDNYDVAFEFSGFKKTYRGRVSATNRNQIWFAAGNDAELRRALAGGGNMVWIDARGQKFTFPLDGADNAMRKLIACTALFGVE
ncbi:MAG: hypothetical protein KIT16_16600 [Rhodospirillaceae bacterium]|nr:hypothetical protein [Rhodospirillaceae bacterium]